MILAQGAEAVLVKNGNFVVKERLSKGYRLAEIDASLRKSRTRREAKMLEKLSKINVLAPRLEKMDDKAMKVTMSFIEGEKVRDILGKENCATIGNQIGKSLGKMHAAGIMHADLTTSNMIVNEKGLHFIDFGLSFFSDKVEDRAVDLHLLYETMQGIHYDVLDLCWSAIVTGYTLTYPDASSVLKRYEEVAMRGRNKNPKRHTGFLML